MSSRHLRLSLASSLFGLLWTPAAAAQYVLWNPFYGPEFYLTGEFVWPSGQTLSGALGRGVAGDFVGGGAKDVIFVSGTKLAIAYEPAIWNGFQALDPGSTVTVNDIDRLRFGGFGRCALAVVGNAGLERYTFTHVNEAIELARTSISSHSAWVGALKVRVGDVDGDDRQDFVGLSANGTTLVVLRDKPDHPIQSTFTMPWSVYDIALLEWDGDADLEIAFIDDYGVEVFDYNGVRVNRFARVGAVGDVIVPFRKAADTSQRIAWARRDAQGVQSVVELLYDPNGPVLHTTDIVFDDPSGPFAASNKIVRMAVSDSPTADADCDGADELLVYHQQHFAPILFKNTQSTNEEDPSFTSDADFCRVVNHGDADPSLTSFAGSASMPQPIYEDLDGDEVADLFLPVQTTSATRFQVLAGKPYPGIGQQLGTGGFLRELALDPAELSPMSSASDHDILATLRFTSWTEDTNALEVIVRKRDMADPSVPTNSAATYDTVGVGRHYFTFAIGGAWNSINLEPIIPIGSIGSLCWDEEYWFEYHLANWDGQTLSPIGQTFVAVVGTHHSPLAGLWEDYYSEARCFMDTLAQCPTELEIYDCAAGGTPQLTSSTAGFRKHRLAPTNNGTPPPSVPPVTSSSTPGAFASTPTGQ